MDKAYLNDLPRFERTLREYRRRFARVETPTDWTGLRIVPLLAHVKRLRALLASPQYAREVARLRQGVRQFRADLIYLRTNLETLAAILAKAEARPAKRKPRASSRPKRSKF